MLPYTEDISVQIDKSHIFQNELYSKSKVQNALRELCFDFDDFRTFKEKIEITQKLRQNTPMLKPDKALLFLIIKITLTR